MHIFFIDFHFFWRVYGGTTVPATVALATLPAFHASPDKIVALRVQVTFWTAIDDRE